MQRGTCGEGASGCKGEREDIGSVQRPIRGAPLKPQVSPFALPAGLLAAFPPCAPEVRRTLTGLDSTSACSTATEE